MPLRLQGLACCALLLAGCSSMKESDTARTGVEQLLISSAVDRALDKVSFASLRGAKVFVEEKYLDCTDKNYVIVSLHQRVMRAGCKLVDKADDADVILELASGAVGTDRNDAFLGVPWDRSLNQGQFRSRTEGRGRRRASGVRAGAANGAARHAVRRAELSK
jgi:hypothetical protein